MQLYVKLRLVFLVTVLSTILGFHLSRQPIFRQVKPFAKCLFSSTPDSNEDVSILSPPSLESPKVSSTGTVKALDELVIGAAVGGGIIGLVTGGLLDGALASGDAPWAPIVGLGVGSGSAYYATTVGGIAEGIVKDLIGTPVIDAKNNAISSIKTKISSIKTSLRTKLENFVIDVKNIPTTVKAAVKTQAENVKTSIQKKVDDTIADIKAIPSKAQISLNKAVEDQKKNAQAKLDALVTDIKGTPDRLVTAAKSKADSVVADLQKVPEQAGKAIVQTAEKKIDSIKGSLPKVPSIPIPSIAVPSVTVPSIIPLAKSAPSVSKSVAAVATVQTPVTESKKPSPTVVKESVTAPPVLQSQSKPSQPIGNILSKPVAAVSPVISPKPAPISPKSSPAKASAPSSLASKASNGNNNPFGSLFPKATESTKVATVESKVSLEKTFPKPPASPKAPPAAVSAPPKSASANIFQGLFSSSPPAVSSKASPVKAATTPTPVVKTTATSVPVTSKEAPKSAAQSFSFFSSSNGGGNGNKAVDVSSKAKPAPAPVTPTTPTKSTSPSNPFSTFFGTGNNGKASVPTSPAPAVKSSQPAKTTVSSSNNGKSSVPVVTSSAAAAKVVTPARNDFSKSNPLTLKTGVASLSTKVSTPVSETKPNAKANPFAPAPAVKTSSKPSSPTTSLLSPSTSAKLEKIKAGSTSAVDVALNEYNRGTIGPEALYTRVIKSLGSKDSAYGALPDLIGSLPRGAEKSALNSFYQTQA